MKPRCVRAAHLDVAAIVVALGVASSCTPTELPGSAEPPSITTPEPAPGATPTTDAAPYPMAPPADARSNTQPTDTRPPSDTKQSSDTMLVVVQPPPGSMPPPPAAPASSLPFDTTKLHQVELRVAAEHLTALAQDRTKRVPCDVTFDGIALPKSGIRRKGRFGSLSETKPSFSVALDEFVPGQNLDGLDKLVLNNAKQDPTLLAEHTIYELYRWAGLPAPRTAHAEVMFNGKALGIYIVREAIDRGFLSRTFGKAARNGNLYEGDPEFATLPLKVSLKHEKDEMRSRDDILALAELMMAPIGPAFDQAFAAKVRVREAMTAFAIDALMSNWDSYWFNRNNYYLFHNPVDDRFLFIPSGADWLWSPIESYPNIVTAPTPTPDPLPFLSRPPFVRGRLAVRLRDTSEGERAFRNELTRVLRELWDVGKLQTRIDQVARLVRGSTRVDPAIQADRKAFELVVERTRSYMAARKEHVIGLLR